MIMFETQLEPDNHLGNREFVMTASELKHRVSSLSNRDLRLWGSTPGNPLQFQLTNAKTNT